MLSNEEKMHYHSCSDRLINKCNKCYKIEGKIQKLINDNEMLEKKTEELRQKNKELKGKTGTSERIGEMFRRGLGKDRFLFTKRYSDNFALFLRADGTTQIIEGVEPGGTLTINVKEKGKKVKKRYFIEKGKMFKVKAFKGDDYNVWFIDEREAFALPLNPKHDPIQLENIINVLQLNYKNAEARIYKLGTERIWTIVIAIVIMVIILVGFQNQIISFLQGVGVLGTTQQNLYQAVNTSIP